MKHILIINVHSALNLGDDGIMEVTLRGIRTVFPHAHITIAANDAESWQKYATDGIAIVPSLLCWVGDPRLGRWRARAWIMSFVVLCLLSATLCYRLFGMHLRWGDVNSRQLMNCYYEADLVLSCGGGNYYTDRRFSITLFWILASLLLAVGLGKRVVMLPQSFGPIHGWLQRIAARWVLARVPQIMVREPKSYAFLTESLSIQRRPILLPDLAFQLSALHRFGDRDVDPIFQTGAFKLGITAMDRGAQLNQFQSQTQYEQALLEVARYSAEVLGAHVYLFVQCTGPSPDQDDRTVAQRLLQQIQTFTSHVYLLDQFLGPLELQAAYAQMDFVVGTRMHAGIFAITALTPTILIAYQSKSLGMMKMLGLGQFCLNIEELTEERLLAMFIEMVKDGFTIRDQLQRQTQWAHTQLVHWISYLEG